MHSQS
jgi:surface protein